MCGALLLQEGVRKPVHRSGGNPQSPCVKSTAWRSVQLTSEPGDDSTGRQAPISASCHLPGNTAPLSVSFGESHLP